MSKNKPLSYRIIKRQMKVGKQVGKTLQFAVPTRRRSIGFDRFCELVSDRTTFSYMEVAAILNLAADQARTLVANGDSVSLGRLGYLHPSFRSKGVPEGEEFSAGTHILQAVVRLRPNRRFFQLSDVVYEREGAVSASPASAKPAGGKPGTKPSGEDHSSHSSGSEGVPGVGA